MKQLLIISFMISLALGISSLFILKPQRVKCEIIDIQAEQTAYRGSYEYTVQSYTASSGLCDVDDYKGWLEVDNEPYHVGDTVKLYLNEGVLSNEYNLSINEPLEIYVVSLFIISIVLFAYILMSFYNKID